MWYNTFLRRLIHSTHNLDGITIFSQGTYMKQIPNFSKYKISMSGEVVTIKTGRIRKVHCTDRYTRVLLMNDTGGKNTMSIHRLVALTYIPNPHNKATVNHIDGDKSNNSVSNLEWATQEENQLHADATGLNKVKGTDNGTFKPWFYIVNGVKNVMNNITIKQWCDDNGLQNTYSNVKKYCRKGHTVSRGVMKDYTFGYVGGSYAT